MGDRGPWVALSPGGRRGLDGVLSLGKRIADAGYRVVLHDRRNCGESDVVIDGEDAEFEIWADDLYELLGRLDARPAFAGGSPSGCRLALLLALRHPDAVRGLLLWRVTGGEFAVHRLAKQYYGDFIEAAQQGGMEAVVATEFFHERIESNPANRDRLLEMDSQRFISVMSRWQQAFFDSLDLPVIGATEADLRSIQLPACIVPGNDRTHPREIGENAGRLLPHSEVHPIMGPNLDVDLATDSWDPKEGELAVTFIQFLNRVAVATVV